LGAQNGFVSFAFKRCCRTQAKIINVEDDQRQGAILFSALEKAFVEIAGEKSQVHEELGKRLVKQK
jgi:hypothetical protein